MAKQRDGAKSRVRAEWLLDVLLTHIFSCEEKSTSRYCEWEWREPRGERPRLKIITTMRQLLELLDCSPLTKKYQEDYLSTHGATRTLYFDGADRSKNLGTFLREYFGKVLSILEGKKTNPPYPRWTFTLLLWSQQDVSTNLSGLRKLFRERDAVKNGNKKSALGKLNPDVLRVFQTIIEEKTKDFLGRDYIFDAIDRFLYENLCGYFLITAKPGMGKSALLAEYVRRNGCVAYFNVRSEGINRAEQFLESISIQLIEQYELDYPSLPVYAKQDGRFLGQLLQEVAVKSSEPVVIAIDALDEVSFDSQSAGANVLYLPRHLPHGIYIVLTKRSDVQVPFYVEAPQNVYDLMDENLVESNLQDIQAYIRHISHRDNIRHWIQSCELTVEEFINQLTVKSEYNFMYLYYVLRDISVDKYQDLSIEKLPVGLEGYYEDHWRRMGMLQTPLPRTKLKIIYVLVEVSHPVSSFLISDITKESKLTVQEVIDEWKQFLLEQNIDKQKCYSVYHASFSDFLYRKDIVQAADVMVDDINALIANDLWEGLYGND